MVPCRLRPILADEGDECVTYLHEMPVRDAVQHAVWTSVPGFCAPMPCVHGQCRPYMRNFGHHGRELNQRGGAFSPL